MARLPRLDSGWGTAVVRIIMGCVLIITGHEKLISGIQRVSATMLKNRIPFPTVAAAYITTLELVGGVLLLIGLGARWLGLLYIGEFLVVSFYVLVPRRGWMDARLPIMRTHHDQTVRGSSASSMIVSAGSPSETICTTSGKPLLFSWSAVLSR